MILVTAFYYTKQLKDQEKIEAKAKREIEQTALKNRFLKGPYVANESELSEYETAKTIIYPGKASLAITMMKCMTAHALCTLTPA